MKATEYKIISMLDLEELVVFINQAINDGWQPLGGVSSNGHGQYFQAVIKLED